MAESKKRDRICIEVRDDGLEALLSVFPGEERPPAALRSKIIEAGISFGLEERRIYDFGLQLGDPTWTCRAEMIARGLSPLPGKNAVVELTVETELQPGRIGADGRFDFHERGLLQPVNKGAVLGIYHAATDGVAGRSVLGETLRSRPGAEMRLRLGSGVEVEEGQGSKPSKVVAQRSGVLHYRPGVVLDVADHHLHRGDVNLRSGNLRSEASITVVGNVERGFEVSTAKDLEIKGRVSGGEVRAGGNLWIREGILGQGIAIVEPEGRVCLGFAQECKVVGGESIEVERDAINVDFEASKVSIFRQLRGSKIVCESRISAGQVGTEWGGGSELGVAFPLETTEERARVYREEEGERNRQRRKLASRRGGKRGRAARSMHALDKQRRERLLTYRRRQRELTLDAEIRVEGTLHAGTLIKIGPHQKLISSPKQGVRLHFDADAATIRLDPIDSV